MLSYDTIDADETNYRKEALKDAVITIAWLKLVSVIFYIVMVYFVRTTSEGDVSLAIQIMLLIAIPLQIILGVLLFIGAVCYFVSALVACGGHKKLVATICSMLRPPASTVCKSPVVLDIALWLCLALASYITVLGIFGAVYFIRIGHTPIHFVLVVAFVLLAIALFMVLCHDILIIFAYKQMLLTFPEMNAGPAGSSRNVE